MKKWLASLLLLITLAGTFVPCCGDDDCCNEQVTLTSSEEDSPERTCSPFFACSTCPGFTNLSKPMPVFQAEQQKQVHNSHIILSELSTFDLDFWQPPRVA